MKVTLLAASLALPLAAPGQAPEPQPQAETPQPIFETQRTARNMLQEPRPGCTPIVVQVAGEDREYRGTRLDQQPPAQLLYAVDRQVDGCREVTFVTGRRTAAPLTHEEEPSAQ